eukprot:comp23471_c0_seq1/m.39216 comp23471_c0_seq1/g.39216  ORF comp23471_c0_seq1/g.39216 comp23471_c0_seq1/m.39216 type:complete len:888 (-) comp23471_c0_seq1:214-2877(-)
MNPLARLVAIPAVVGAAGYEALRRRMNLPENPLLEKADELKERATDFLATLRSSVPNRRKLEQARTDESDTQDDQPSVPPPPPADNSTPPPPPPEQEPLPELPPEKEGPDLPSLLEAMHNLQHQLDTATAKHQGEIMEERARLQKDIETLRTQNEELRASYLQLRQRLTGGPGGINGSHKKSAIEMYSDILDLVVKYKKDFNTQDHLPRIVVVGDQSAGKTSVLEMLAHARIFPRGHGEMMTKAPVQVTLSEGPLRRAVFADGGKQYDLTNQKELQQLRAEIKRRMDQSIEAGQTITSRPVTLHVQGPGLPRMVMVDLPGIISHVTAGMASQTKEDITSLARHYMDNPNAIIVCVQDGSVDAERSNVADLVASVDPKGSRTVFVMTKMDVAEQQHTSAARIRSIMEGRLFRMHALGYYAVVTGKGDANEDIEDIKRYEQDYFAKSQFFRDGVLRPQQTTTENLSRAISQEFWKLVKDSVTQETEAIRGELTNKELEWKNKYKGRLMSRDELFQLGKHEILESVAAFDSITPKQWENMLSNRMYQSISQKLIKDIYLTAAKSTTTDFKTRVDVQMLDWARRDLSSSCVDVSKDSFLAEFERIVKSSVVDTMQENGVGLFDKIKDVVVQNCRSRHTWSPEVVNNLKVIQINTLEDDELDAGDWQDAADFMAEKLNQQSKEWRRHLRDMFGPEYVEQWLQWKGRNPDQARSAYIRHELTSYLAADKVKPQLDYDDLVTVRNNVRKSRGMDITDDQIREVYEAMYMDDFLKRSAQSAAYCRPMYQVPEHRLGKVPNNLGCQDIVLFWRVQEMLRSTSRVMRQQVMSHRVRLEEEVKQELEGLGQSESAKQELLTGERVALAEQIEGARTVYHRLTAFARQLNAAPKPATVV